MSIVDALIAEYAGQAYREAIGWRLSLIEKRQDAHSDDVTSRWIKGLEPAPAPAGLDDLEQYYHDHPVHTARGYLAVVADGWKATQCDLGDVRKMSLKAVRAVLATKGADSAAPGWRVLRDAADAAESAGTGIGDEALARIVDEALADQAAAEANTGR